MQLQEGIPDLKFAHIVHNAPFEQSAHQGGHFEQFSETPSSKYPSRQAHPGTFTRFPLQLVQLVEFNSHEVQALAQREQPPLFS
jgi:hypothetical protein